jgi:hypothetical protein
MTYACSCHNPQCYKRKSGKADVIFCLLCAGSRDPKSEFVLLDKSPEDALKLKPRAFHYLDHVLVEWPNGLLTNHFTV